MLKKVTKQLIFLVLNVGFTNFVIKLFSKKTFYEQIATGKFSFSNLDSLEITEFILFIICLDISVNFSDYFLEPLFEILKFKIEKPFPIEKSFLLNEQELLEKENLNNTSNTNIKSREALLKKAICLITVGVVLIKLFFSS